MKAITILLALVMSVVPASTAPIIICERNYMEVCIPQHQSTYWWASGNAGDVLSAGLVADSCASYDKDIASVPHSCATTLYSEEYTATPLMINAANRYSCANKVVENGNFVTIENSLGLQSGLNLGSSTDSYVGRCTYNRRWEDLSISFDIPAVETMYVSDEGELNSELKFCTTEDCTGWYNIPASKTDSDEFVLQITTPGSGLFPRVRNCYVSPTVPVRPADGTPHPDQLQIVTEYCMEPTSPLAALSKLYTPAVGAAEDVRLKVPSFSFVGSTDVDTGDALDFVYIMCDVTIALTADVGVDSNSNCHSDGPAQRRLTRVLQDGGADTKTTEEVTVGGAFAVDDPKISISASKTEDAHENEEDSPNSSALVAGCALAPLAWIATLF